MLNNQVSIKAHPKFLWPSITNSTVGTRLPYIELLKLLARIERETARTLHSYNSVMDEVRINEQNKSIMQDLSI